MQYIYRFNIQRGQTQAFVDWVRANEQRMRDNTRPGWHHDGVYVSVQSFGRFDVEFRATIDDYSALGADVPEATQAWLDELFGNFIDTSRGTEAELLKPIGDVLVIVDQ